MSDTLSVIVPCYNEQETIQPFIQAIEQIKPEVPELTVDILFINDGSKDNTLAVLKETSNDWIHYLSFSRNFGKEAALLAGLEHTTKSDYIVVMDVDLQDPPHLIPQMYRQIKEGAYDCVGTRRVTRKGEPPIRSFFARQFYKIINKISNVEFVDGVRDYRLMTRQMTDAILELKEVNRFSKGIFSWVGFDTKYLEYENIERTKGETSWSFWSLLNYSIEGIVSFSEAPLMLATYIGIISFVISIFALLFIVIRALLFGDPTAGWPSLVAIVLALGGLQLFCLGILGKYLGKTFLEVKKRPIYIVKEKDIEK